jgi:hypothetical protein
MRLHAQAIAKDCAAGKWTGRIDSDDTDGLAALARLGHEPIHERALSGARRTGDAGQIGAAGVRKNIANERRGIRGFVFDQRNRARHRPHVAGPYTFGQRGSHQCLIGVNRWPLGRQ